MYGRSIQKWISIVVASSLAFNATVSLSFHRKFDFRFYPEAHAEELQCPYSQMGAAVPGFGITFGNVMGIIHCAEKVGGGAKDAVVEMYHGGKDCITSPWQCTKSAAQGAYHKAVAVGKVVAECAPANSAVPMPPVECIEDAMETGQAAIDKTKQIAGAVGLLVDKIKGDPSMIGKSMQFVMNTACAILGRLLVAAGVATVMALATAGVGALVALIGNVAAKIPWVLQLIKVVGTGLKYLDWVLNFPAKITEKVLGELVAAFADMAKAGRLEKMDGILKACHVPGH